MKKLFFTAIVLIAFSNASLANTIANEEIVVKNINNEICQIQTNVITNEKPADWWLCYPVKRTTDILSDGTMMVEVIYRCMWIW